MKLLDLLNEVKNPDVVYRDGGGIWRKIKMSSALKYDKKHPAYKAAQLLLKKNKKKAEPTKKPKGTKIDFTSSAEKKKPSKATPVYKKVKSNTRDTNDVLNALVDKYYKSSDPEIVNGYVKQQSDYWNKSVKNKDFSDNVVAWRDLNVQTSRVKLDKFIIQNPPPPIKTKTRIWRGMGMTADNYKKFVKSIKDKTEIKLPPSSFSFAVDIARYRAEDSNTSVVIGVKSECNELKGLALSRVPGKKSQYEETEQEIITPSNATYKVESIKELEDSRGNAITVVSLIQKCGMNESDETVADFSKDEFMYSLFGPTQRVEK